MHDIEKDKLASSNKLQEFDKHYNIQFSLQEKDVANLEKIFSDGCRAILYNNNTRVNKKN